MSSPRFHRSLLAALALVLLAAPAHAADTVKAGSDVWKTDGGSHASFVNDPIPAGFFCSGSPAFAGTLELSGRPLATHPPDALRGADTVVVRDDDATFTVGGVARVNARVAALSLEGTSPLTVSCTGGPVTWNVLVYADDPAVLSDLVVVRTSLLGGTFSGTLRVPAVIRFTNAADPGMVLELDNDVEFAIPAGAEWTGQPAFDGWSSPAASVDTNGDGRPDTAIPAASDFFPGTSPNRQPGCARPPCPVRIRHTREGNHGHLVAPPPPPCEEPPCGPPVEVQGR